MKNNKGNFLQDARSFNDRLKRWWHNLKFYVKNMPVYKHLLIVYIVVTLSGTLLLMMPISRASGNNTRITFMDALFHSASAFSDTGLTTLPTYSTWSAFGQAVIALLILVGGIGVFAIKVYIYNAIFRKSASYIMRGVLTAERGTNDVTKSSHIIRNSMIILFSVLIISSIALVIYFYNVEVDMDIQTPGVQSTGDLGISPYKNLGLSFRYGIFHSISSLNNAGFDIIGPVSLAPYYSNFGLQIIFVCLFVIGGVGYPCLHDLFMFVRAKIKKEVFRWSLFTKLSMVTYVLISILGIGLVFLFEVTAKSTGDNATFWEYNGSEIPLGTKGQKALALIFNTLSTRNAGFATMSMHDLSQPTLLTYSIMMFIGSAPASTAGGIRTTTFAILFMSMIGKLNGRESVRAFKKRVNSSTVSNAYTVFTISMFIVIMGTLIGTTSFGEHSGLINTDGNHPNNHPFSIAGPSENFSIIHMIFEVSSAFGTTGLSAGITGSLSMSTKIALIFIMFTGQLGISTSIQFWGKRNSKGKSYKYVEEDIIIG